MEGQTFDLPIRKGAPTPAAAAASTSTASTPTATTSTSPAPASTSSESDSNPAVQVRPHPTRGRGLYATSPFLPGDIILSLPPLLLLPSRSVLPSLCSHCFSSSSSSKTVRACSRCRAAYYCDQTCQAASWAAVHSAECKALRANLPDEARRQDLPTPARAVIQALLKKDIARALDPLEGHVELRKRAGVWENVVILATGASAYAGKGTTEKAVQTACELLSKIDMNAFQRSTDELGLTGLFLEPTLAMANHSCLPNALVQFSGRKVFLRAASAIQPGDEIEISYTALTEPLLERRHLLAAYMFECRCPRCQGDLNAYQVAAASPTLDLNRSMSLVTYLATFREHPALTDATKQSVASRFSQTNGVLSSSLADSRSLLRDSLQEQYRLCARLLNEELWAVTPVPETVAGISDYYFKEGKLAFALAAACLLATACDPFRYPQPFHVSRLHGLLSIAKLLSNTAADTASRKDSKDSNSSQDSTNLGAKRLDKEAQDALDEIDQVSLCQMLLIMILHWTPEKHQAEWEVSAQALEILKDIDQLDGREKELSLINDWKRDPEAEQSKAFFEYAVVQRVEALARIGKAALKRDFGA